MRKLFMADEWCCFCLKRHQKAFFWHQKLWRCVRSAKPFSIPLLPPVRLSLSDSDKENGRWPMRIAAEPSNREVLPKFVHQIISQKSQSLDHHRHKKLIIVWFNLLWLLTIFHFHSKRVNWVLKSAHDSYVIHQIRYLAETNCWKPRIQVHATVWECREVFQSVWKETKQ